MFVSTLRRRVGWFVMLGFGAIVLILLSLSLRTDLFADKFHLTFSPASATAFYIGQPVKFQGFGIGRIDGMDLNADGQVQISMRLLERFRPMLHENAIVHLVRDGLIGEQTLEITAGDKQQAVLQNGQMVVYETAASLEQLLQDVKPAVANANTLLRELASLATWMNDPNSDIRQMTARLNAISRDLNRENVAEVVQRIDTVMQNMQALTGEFKEQKIATQLATTLQASNRILADLQPLSAQITKDGPTTLTRMNEMITHVNKLSKSLDIISSDVSELSPELPGLVRESKATVQEMRATLKEVRGSWLLGGRQARSEHTEATATVAAPAMDFTP